MKQPGLEEITCSVCAGSGEGMADGSTCWSCKGSGMLGIALLDEDDGDAEYDQWNEEERV